MAPYEEDGKYYPAKILKIKSDECEIVYTEYDTNATVKLSTLLRYLAKFAMKNVFPKFYFNNPC